MQLLCGLEDAMDELVEISEDVLMEVINDFAAELAANLLNGVYVFIALVIELVAEYVSLHLVVVAEKLGHGAIDRSLLTHQVIVDLLPHPGQKVHENVVSLQPHLLRSHTEVQVLVLLLKLLAPLAQNTHDLRALQLDPLIKDLVLRVKGSVFRDLTADQIVSVFLHLGPVVLLGLFLLLHRLLRMPTTEHHIALKARCLPQLTICGHPLLILYQLEEVGDVHFEKSVVVWLL
jgi:hypothetical protein